MGVEAEAEARARAVSMVTIDPRAGSGELAKYFDRVFVPYQLKEQQFGDFSFEGHCARGPGMIGIERKTIPDMLACMVSARFVGKQLPGMLECYEQSYLVVEGITRPHPTEGILQIGTENQQGGIRWVNCNVFTRYPMKWRAFDGFLTTLEHSKLKVRRTDNQMMTVNTIASLYHWYRDKKWSEHDSLRGLYSEPYKYFSLEDKSSIVRRVAKEFQGIGVDKSLSVHMKFPTVWDMITALREDWLSIPGIGDTIADSVQKEIHERQF